MIGLTAGQNIPGCGRHLLMVESQDADGNWGVPSAVFLDIE
ncbi:MAG: hypothetical protein ABI134_35850 [Byssovorax sp.]